MRDAPARAVGLAWVASLLVAGLAAATVAPPPNHGVEGFVVGDTGQPLARGQVARLEPDFGYTWLERDGHFRLYGYQPMRIQAWAPDHAPAEGWAEPAEGFAWRNLTLPFIGPTGLEGTVRSASGEPLIADLFPEGPTFAGHAVSDYRGAYRLDLWAGTWTIHVVSEGYSTLAQRVTLENGTLLATELVLAPRTEELRLRVLDNQTLRSLDATVHLSVGHLCAVYPERKACYREHGLPTGDDGALTQPLEGAFVKLQVCAPGYATRRLEQEATGSLDLELRLEPLQGAWCRPLGSPDVGPPTEQPTPPSGQPPTGHQLPPGEPPEQAVPTTEEVPAPGDAISPSAAAKSEAPPPSPPAPPPGAPRSRAVDEAAQVPGAGVAIVAVSVALAVMGARRLRGGR